LSNISLVQEYTRKEEIIKEKYNKTTVETKLYTVSQSYQQRGFLHVDRPSVKKLFF